MAPNLMAAEASLLRCKDTVGGNYGRAPWREREERRGASARRVLWWLPYKEGTKLAAATNLLGLCRVR